MARRAKEPRGFSDAVVKARTGKSSAQWYRLLDKWGAKKKGHTLTAKYLLKRYRLSPWWAQVVTIPSTPLRTSRHEYARGLRK
ncbi:MAG: hypothetical protein ACE5MH_02395 [Terriglobia bacterium]